MGRLIDIDVLFDYFGNDAIDKTTRSNIEYFVSEKGTVDAIPKAEIKKFLEEGIKDVNNNVLAIVREDYIHKADYENRLKADLKAILVELQLDVEGQKFDVHTDKDVWNDAIRVCSELIQQKINELPTVTPIRPKGYWKTRPLITFCSECGFELKIDNTNYCPNCGAKMESEG